MCRKNFLILKKKLKIPFTSKSLKKQCYLVWSVEKIQKVKSQKCKDYKRKKKCFYQNVHCVIVKNKSKKLEDY